MEGGDLVVRSRRIVTPDGVWPGTIVISGGVIRRVVRGGAGAGGAAGAGEAAAGGREAGPRRETTAGGRRDVGSRAEAGAGELEAAGEAVEPEGGEEVDERRPVLDVGEAAVMAGVVDVHVHFNEPGRAYWEGFHAGTRAAAAGGVTTVVDMPLNSLPVTTGRAALESKLRAADGRCRVDHGFWGGVVPGSLGEVEDLLGAGVLGVKCFLTDSGIEEFPPLGTDELRTAMELLARHDGLLLAHAEAPGPLERAAAAPRSDPRRYLTWLASRPPEAEVEAVELLVRLCEETGCRVHVVHVSAAEALAPLARARGDGLPVTAETCPHYLTFAAEEIPDGATAFKCAPPIRGGHNRDKLWEALAAGELNLVASDHSPAPPHLKRPRTGSFVDAWGGISSLQLLLPAVWTEAHRRCYDLPRLAEWLCAAPAAIAGLGTRKGRLEPGFDADFVVWDPEARFLVVPGSLHHRHAVSPYAGMELEGRVSRTFVRGMAVFEAGDEVGGSAGGEAEGEADAFPDPPRGRWLRGPA